MNIRNESVLQIAVLLAGKYNVSPYFELIKYLVEVVGVDLSYNYEETLILCQDSKLCMYLENKLADIGVFTSKFELEKEDNPDFHGFED